MCPFASDLNTTYVRGFWHCKSCFQTNRTWCSSVGEEVWFSFSKFLRPRAGSAYGRHVIDNTNRVSLCYVYIADNELLLPLTSSVSLQLFWERCCCCCCRCCSFLLFFLRGWVAGGLGSILLCMLVCHWTEFSNPARIVGLWRNNTFYSEHTRSLLSSQNPNTTWPTLSGTLICKGNIV